MSQGFTLLELLVVIVIVGVLASIALPQYQVAVEKSRVAEALSTGNSVAEAMSRAYIERPFMTPNTRSSLDVLPAGVSWTGSSTFQTLDFSYDLGDGTCLTITRQVRDGSYTIKIYTEASNQGGKRTCSSEGSTGADVCRSLVGIGVDAL